MNFDTPSVDVRACWQPPALRSSHAIGHWLPALFLLVIIMPWLLGGCGGGGSSGTGYADRPPSDRVAYTAWQEWTKFGRSTVVYGGQANGYVNRSGVTERSEPLTSKILLHGQTITWLWHAHKRLVLLQAVACLRDITKL